MSMTADNTRNSRRARTRSGAAARRVLATIQEWAVAYRTEFGSADLDDLLTSAEACARIANCIDDEFAGLVADVFARKIGPPTMSDRSTEANKLRTDLDAGRLMEQAVHQARQAYHFAPNTYTYECLSAVLRLKRQLQQLLRPVTGEDADRSPMASPLQGELI
jgi:hypothetical protein